MQALKPINKFSVAPENQTSSTVQGAKDEIIQSIVDFDSKEKKTTITERMFLTIKGFL